MRTEKCTAKAQKTFPLRVDLRQAAIASVKRYVASNLNSPDLSAAAICARAGWSRATVYRLFEPDGGLVNYVRHERLQRAFTELTAGNQHRRLLDIALESQFASESTFNRAFRRMFGMPPGELRSLARRGVSTALRC